MPQDLSANTCRRCGKWAGAHATLPGQPRDHLCMCPGLSGTPTPALNIVEQQAAEIARLRAERDTLRADAERYRWLRSGSKARQGFTLEGGARIIPRNELRALMGFNYWCRADELDAAIDAARKEST